MKMLLVAVGGAVGSMARFQIGSMVLARTETWAFPLGTFIVNVLGCLIAGILIGVAEYRAFLTLEMRLLIFTGFLGGFTTFSAFGVETVALIERGQYVVAATYVLSSVVVGLGALLAAVKIISA
ncbi:MAG TPA: fluoride efflux transporter CrcB [Burkholderiales bacterium]|jgi:CrcB protein|nr:fluoride efflux transporter CrcB [Burkholderiales bacterium]